MLEIRFCLILRVTCFRHGGLVKEWEGCFFTRFSRWDLKYSICLLLGPLIMILISLMLASLWGWVCHLSTELRLDRDASID